MREELEKINGQRSEFRAVFVRFGEKSAYKGPPIVTALFHDIQDSTGAVLCDHIWFTLGKQMADLNLLPGDVVAFAARVTPYYKGYRGRRNGDDEGCMSKDYRLSFPTRVWVVSRRIKVQVETDGQLALTV